MDTNIVSQFLLSFFLSWWWVREDCLTLSMDIARRPHTIAPRCINRMVLFIYAYTYIHYTYPVGIHWSMDLEHNPHVPYVCATRASGVNRHGIVSSSKKKLITVAELFFQSQRVLFFQRCRRRRCCCATVRLFVGWLID